jgi:predicted NBD/HSP70 family sugar kinase
VTDFELKKWMGNDSTGDATTRIVRLLSQSGSLSAAEIARDLNLAKSTVSSALIELRRAGMVVDAEKAATARRASAGRPSTALTLNPRAGACIGVMIAPTFLRVVLADVSHAILDEDRCEMPVGYSPQAAARATRDLVERLCKRSEIRQQALLGVGLAVPGPVRPDTGHVLRASMVPTWAGSDIRASFEAEFQLPIFADNESNCAAIAEMTWGAAVGCDDFVFFKVDVGIGGAIVVNGKVLTGRAGGAGEFGHMVIDPQGDLCVCGARGCLELYGGFGTVMRHAERRFGPDLTIERVVDLALDGDAGCRRLIADAGEAAGRGLALIGTALNPPLIVVGGRGCRAGELLLAPLRQAYERFVQIKRSEGPDDIGTPIVAGHFPNDDSALGAVGLVLRYHGRLGANAVTSANFQPAL